MDDMMELNSFIGKAVLATYAGSGPETGSSASGFTELDFREGQWYYKDSYTGFFRSWGRETVWRDEEPLWTQLYGGGMEEEFIGNKDFALQTFQFLKSAMSSGDKIGAFQPRGPKNFTKGDWSYECGWEGGIKSFKGSEKIHFKGKLVFTHDFFGGLVKGE